MKVKKWKEIEISGIGEIAYLCPYCGRKSNKKSNFCPECGEKINKQKPEKPKLSPIRIIKENGEVIQE